MKAPKANPKPPQSYEPDHQGTPEAAGETSAETAAAAATAAEDKQWGIKNMPPGPRKAATEAAKAAGVSVGEWIAEAITRRLAADAEAAEREAARRAAFERGEAPPGTAVVPWVAPPLPAPPTLAEVGEILALAATMKEITGEAVPAGLKDLAFRVMRGRLAVGLPTKAKASVAA